MLAIVSSRGENLEIDQRFLNDHNIVCIYNSSIPNNIIYLQVFENNIQIRDFKQV